MSSKQKALVGMWIALVAILILGTIIEPDKMIWVMLPIVGLAILNKDQLSAGKWGAPSPVRVFEQNPVWKYVAVIYTFSVVTAVLYHLFVQHLSIFEDPPFILFFLALLGPMLGPLIVSQVQAYRNLGKEQ